MMRKTAKIFTGLVLSCALLLSAAVGAYCIYLPDRYYLTEGVNSFKIGSFFNIETKKQQVAKVSKVYAGKDASTGTATNYAAELKLFGVIPVKTVQAEEIERPMLIPCGTPFGIKMLTGGAIITEFGEVDGVNGFSSPAKNSKLAVGDVVVEVNGMPVRQNSDITAAVQRSPEVTIVNFTRGSTTELQTAELIPVKSNQDGLYKIGMWVRDSSAGIGTMTYYNPTDGTFGGLGHAVCDVDTGQILPMASGEAVAVTISSVTKGASGSPGELIGSFMSRVAIGQILGNSESGVFGVMENPPVPEDAEPLPMAFKQEVHIGPAKMIATVNGNIPAEYDVLIEKIDYNDKHRVKNMVIRIVDNKLLSVSGGIVQGMSGSPIVQNGRLAGAVTHVFVSDPARGYGIFAENMFRESVSVLVARDDVGACVRDDVYELQPAA